MKKRTQILATVLALAMTTLSVGAQPLSIALPGYYKFSILFI